MANIPVAIEPVLTTSAQVQDQLDCDQTFRVLEKTRMAEEVDPVVTLAAARMLTIRDVDNLELKFEWDDAEGASTVIIENCRFGNAIADPFDMFDIGEGMTSVGLLQFEVRDCKYADGTPVENLKATLVGILPA